MQKAEHNRSRLKVLTYSIKHPVQRKGGTFTLLDVAVVWVFDQPALGAGPVQLPVSLQLLTDLLVALTSEFTDGVTDLFVFIVRLVTLLLVVTPGLLLVVAVRGSVTLTLHALKNAWTVQRPGLVVFFFTVFIFTLLLPPPTLSTLTAKLSLSNDYFFLLH